VQSFHKAAIVCGKVTKCVPLEGSEKLFLCQLQISESESRELVTGLQHYYEASELEGKMVACIVNLKPAKLAGVMSYAMIIAGSYEEDGKEIVKILEVPASAAVGDKIELEEFPTPEPFPLGKNCNDKQWKKIVKEFACFGKIACVDKMKLKHKDGYITCDLPDGSEIH
ncbi:hypothetical protein ADUPG1_007180, partial [Aduncisulcus paluster]